MSFRSIHHRDRWGTACVGILLTLIAFVVLDGCSGDDNAVPVPVDGSAASGPSDASSAGDGGKGGDADARAPEAGATKADAGEAAAAASDGSVQDVAAAPGSAPVASLSENTVNFGAVGCGAAEATQTLTVKNAGGSTLVVSATVTGAEFTVSPSSISVASGGSGAFSLTATVPGSATAATALTGSLALFTNDPKNANILVVLTVTPTGATLTGTSQYTFASTEIGVAAPPVALRLQNVGNAPALLSIAPVTVASVTIAGQTDAGIALSLNPGATWSPTADYTPTGSAAISANASITSTGVLCGLNLTTLTFTGSTATGVLSGWPTDATVDFGPAPCGRAAPSPQTLTLTNSGTTGAQITSVDTSGIGQFTTTASTGQSIPPNGGSLAIQFTAPAVPPPSASSPTVSLNPVRATVVIHTDADPPSSQGTSLTLTEEPQGAILAFNSMATANFGNFGQAGVLLQSTPSQSFEVTNTGNAPANVTLAATQSGISGPTTEGGALDDSGGPVAFEVSVPTFAIAAEPAGSAPSEQQESLSFRPDQGGTTTGSLAMAVDSATVLCQLLPAALPLSGSAIGGGPDVAPTLLTFDAPCGGAAPASETFVVSNKGTADLTWTLSGITGPGAAQYTVTASPPPGLLVPNASSTVTVTAAAIPFPAPNPNPAALAAQVIVTTDVPNDPPHLVTLNEVAVGDQLSVSVGTLRFGQVSLGTSVSQTFTLTNSANSGSADANVTLTVLGAGSAAYAGSQQASSLAAGASAAETIVFDPTTVGSAAATLSFVTSDTLCTALPTPIVLSGTGTAGSVSLSATSLAFGQPGDSSGLVNCSATGTTQTLTISNVGNQTFNVTSVTLGRGSSSPFALSGPTTTAIPINGSATVTLTPTAIPAIADPNDPSAFSDALTLVTDAAGDMPHVVPLVMQARGAVIANTALPTAWSFGMVGPGSIGLFTTSISNTGNAPATVTLQELGDAGLELEQSTMGIFGLQSNPLTVPPSSVTAVVGQFSPPSANGNWTDTGQLLVTAPDAFCAPLPSQWVTPTIDLSGSSNSSPVIALTGSLIFPTTDCGGAPPGGQSVTLTNSTNRSLAYSVAFASGTYYTLADSLADSGFGTLAANASATIVVNPKILTPAPGVIPGFAPYADNLIIDVFTGPADAAAATSVANFTVPISWTLNGAVLSLPQGAGPYSNSSGSFYVADSTSGFPLAFLNTGTASATVSVAVQPAGAFDLQPPAPISVLPGLPSLPELVSGGSTPACPATSSGVATFIYSGPVCQPFSLPSVNVQSCSGTYTSASSGPSDAGAGLDAGLDASLSDASLSDASLSDASLSDATLEGGGMDAGTEAGGPPTACTQFPCAAAGPNSIQCDQNTNGVCTQTEALLVTRDIEKGLVTGSRLTEQSCYECMVAADCIDSTVPANDYTGLECDDLVTDASSTEFQPCLNTLNCILGSPQAGTPGSTGTPNPLATAATLAAACANDQPPTGDGVFNCFCGSAETDTNDCKNGATVAAGVTTGGLGSASPNGSCIIPILAGIPGVSPSTGNGKIIEDLSNTAYGSGQAFQILQCAGTNLTGSEACKVCYQ